MSSCKSVHNVIKLRPHHILCTKFFCGSGYSGEFVDNMGKVIAEMKSGADIMLTDKHDNICGSCPNRLLLCADSVNYDRRVLELCKIKYGEIYSYSELERLAEEKIISCGTLKEVCGGCEWFYICSR